MTQSQTLTLYPHRRRRRASRNARRLVTESLESRTLLAGDVWQNPALVTDVNADGFTSPLDALHVINELNTSGPRSLRTGAPPAQSSLFYDVNGDDYVTPVDALVVLNALNAEGEEDDLVRIRLVATDTNGIPITAVDVDEPFQLRGFVQDLTARPNGGVFAAYLDVTYDPTLASVNGNIVFGDSYGDVQSGDTSVPGLIDEVGALDGLTPLGPSERLLFLVPMVGTSDGVVTFTPDPADQVPLHDVLLYGFGSAVPADEISFISDTVTIGDVDVPVAVDDQYETVVGQPLDVSAQLGVLANDIGTGLTAVVVDGPDSGQFAFNPDGSFTYTPDANFTGNDVFTYVASNGQVNSNVATVTISVVPENTPPVAVDDDYVTPEDTIFEPLEGVLINDFDDDGDPLTARLISNPSHGTVTFRPNGTFTYVPLGNFSGQDTFEYVANDGQDDSNVATVTIDVQPVNDRPIARPDEYALAKNTTLEVDAESGVLANDEDPEGNPLTAILVTTTVDGTLTLNDDGSFTYVPDLDFAGTDSFTYVASDGTSNSEEALVTLTIVDDFQVRFRLETSNLGGLPITSVAPGENFLLEVFVQDISPLPRNGVFAAYMDVLYDSTLVSLDGPLEFNPVYSNQQSGTTTTPGLIDEAGAFDGLSPLGESERLLFRVEMMANQPGVALFTSDPADVLPAHDTLLYGVSTAIPPVEIEYGTIELTIGESNPPVAVDDSYETDEDVPLIVSAAEGVLKNDSDPEDNPLSAVLISQPAHGGLVFNSDGSFVYSPTLNFAGQDAFTYRAWNGAVLSNLATVTIDVNSVSDPPVAVDDRYFADVNLPLVVGVNEGILVNDSDIEGRPLSAVLVEGPTHGELTLNSNGSFNYVPDLDFVGTDTYTYRAVAGGQESNIATVRIDVGDMRPSSIQGFVYVDTDNDGRLDSGEYRIGGVEVTLTGVDFLGNAVDLSTRTDGDGSYEFTELIRGEYLLTEFQPQFLIDGKDTHQGEPSLRNDRFMIDLEGGVAAGNYNFGERGLEPQFITNPWFFASRDSEYLLTMVDGVGQTQWYMVDAGWSGFRTINVQLAGNRSTAELTATDYANNSQTAVVRVLGNPQVAIAGGLPDGYLLKMNGSPNDFGLSDPAEGESLSAEAIDAVFAGPDA